MSGGRAAQSVHMTHPQPHQQGESRWPALAAVGFVAVAVGLTVAPWLALLGVLAIGVSIGGLARELNPPPSREVAPEEGPVRSQEQDDVWRRFPKHVWLGAGISVSAAMVYVSILRAFVAHSLLDPSNWPPVAQDLATPPAFAGTFAIVAGAAAAVAGGLALRRGRRTAALAGLGAAILLGVAFLGTFAPQWARLAQEGFLPWEDPAASGYYAITSFHMLSVLAGLIVLGILTWQAVDHRLGAGRRGALWGALVYWMFTAASWVLTFLVVHLRLVTWDGQVLL